LRKAWGADADTIVIGFVGRLAPEKQVHKIGTLGDVGILAGKNIVQVIVGEGPTKKSLEKTLPKAIFTGHLSGDDLSRAMASMDLLVTTGENETFCQVIQEAMASKIAVIAPNIGGPVDLIEDGVDGALYQPGENLDIRKKVLLAISDSEKLAAMADAGFMRVQAKTWESICGQLFAMFTEVVRNDRIMRTLERSA
jgi:phosphatidylinositol alpha 1,6-mannosyltransferase